MTFDFDIIIGGRNSGSADCEFFVDFFRPSGHIEKNGSRRRRR